MPAPVVPMKAQATDRLPHDDGGWAYEVKWDGMRIVVEVEASDDGRGGSVTAWSGNGADATARFPELAGLAGALRGARSAVLDGEVVALNPTTGRPDFGRLQPRMQAGSPAAIARAAAAQGVQYVVFDVLAVDGRWLLDRPFAERRATLVDLVDAGPCWRVGPSQEGDGDLLLEAVTTQGLEGVMAKRLDSTYDPGRRSPSWLKVKVRNEQEFVVGGWLAGEGARSGTFGALLVGYHDPPAEGPGQEPGPLRYAGRVGTGFNEAALRRIVAELAERARADCPFDPPPPRDVVRRAHWVEPDLVVQVAFGEWTADGILRHPSHLGPRTDKAAAEVGRAP
jgi:bifunctional non-homologous end joining protein LigD